MMLEKLMRIERDVEELGYNSAQAIKSLPELLITLETIVSDYEFCKDNPGYGDRGSAYAESARKTLDKIKGGWSMNMNLGESEFFEVWSRIC